MTHTTEALSDEHAEPVNKRETRSLYKKRVPIYPKSISGHFRRIKWTFLVVLLAVYYVVPWIRWYRGPNAPDQAVLVDFPARRFYFFFIEIWPQEVYYLTGILILAALGLFAVTSMFGRLWCAWGCPQTVWTDLFLWVERLIEGDRSARIRLDRAPWTPSKTGKKIFKHIVWIMISAATGGAWVFYFADAPTLLRDLVLLQAPTAAWLTIAFLTTSTYLMAGHAREQVCTYMCPYARFQAAMLDEESLIVTYRSDRGEPRGKYKRGESWDDRGHCIACNQCVVVCPTGIDIRDGQQLECINCGLCIDACNRVMDGVGLPRGLIALDTLANVESRKKGESSTFHLIRGRTIIYGSVMTLVAGLMVFGLISRSPLDINVLRDRNPLFVTLSDGGTRNAYTFKIINKLHETRTYALSVTGLEKPEISVAGRKDDDKTFTVAPDQLASFRVFLKVGPHALHETATDIEFVLTDTESGTTATYDSVFRGPAR